jgi:hypothetical protein
VAVHYYDTCFDAFKTYLELWHSTFNIPILVTEFSCLVCVADHCEAAHMLTLWFRVLKADRRRLMTKFGRSGARRSSIWSRSLGLSPISVTVGALFSRFTRRLTQRVIGLTDETMGGNSFNQLMGANNEPTALGDYYINVSW